MKVTLATLTLTGRQTFRTSTSPTVLTSARFLHMLILVMMAIGNISNDDDEDGDDDDKDVNK